MAIFELLFDIKLQKRRETHIGPGPGQYGPRYGNDLVVIQ
jgi:hypothetical protein